MSTGVNSLIYKKLLAVYEEVSYIQKDKRNEFHRYTYASEAAIKDHLHVAFTKHGLVMLPPEMLEVTDLESVSEKGKKTVITTAKIRFGVADPATGEFVTGVVFGRGEDSGDKGIYKAITGGLKYFLTTTFLIPTGDDPEEEQVAPQKNGSREAQQAVAEKKIAAMPAAVKPVVAPVPVTTGARAKMPDTNPSRAEVAEPKSDYTKMLEAIQAQKVEFTELDAVDAYYVVLLGFELSHANQIKTLEQGRDVYRALLSEIKKVRANTPIDQGVAV